MLITCPKCSAQYEIPEGVYIPNGKKMKCSNCQHVFISSNEDVVEAAGNDADETFQPVNIDPVMDEKVGEDSVFAEDDVFQPEEVPQPFVPVVPAVVERPEKRGVGVWLAVLSALIFVILVGAGILYRDVLFTNLSKAKMVATAVPAKPEVLPPVINDMHPVDKYVEETPQVVVLPQIQSVRFEKRQEVNLEIQIEGVLKNPTDQQMKLPEKVRAFAYDSEGNILFEKEIYLTDKVLPAGAELSFFGTYQPAPEGVQWVDVSF